MDEEISTRLRQAAKVEELRQYSEEELKQYTEFVDKLACDKSSDLIANGLEEHAKILIMYLIRNATHKVRLFSSALNRKVYNDDRVVDELLSFFSRAPSDGGIYIVLQDKNAVNKLLDPRETASHKFFQACINNPGKCNIKIASDKDASIKEHFLTMDASGYRFCPDKNVTEAVASFNRPTVVANLVRQFEILYNRAQDLKTLEILHCLKEAALDPSLSR